MCCTSGGTFTYPSLSLRCPKCVAPVAAHSLTSLLCVPNVLHQRRHIHLPLSLRCPTCVAPEAAHSFTSLSSVSQMCCTRGRTFTYLSLVGVPKVLHQRPHIHLPLSRRCPKGVEPEAAHSLSTNEPKTSLRSCARHYSHTKNSVSLLIRKSIFHHLFFIPLAFNFYPSTA